MHSREDVVVRFEITVGVGVELVGEHFGVGIVADAEEERAGGEIPDFAGFHVAQLEAGDFLVVDDRKHLPRRCR